MSSPYVLDINPLLDVLFGNIFCHSVGCLLLLLMVSFAVQKLFSLMGSDLFTFAFVSLAFGVKATTPSPPETKIHKFSAHVFFYGLYWFRSYIHVFNPPAVFCVWRWIVV